MSELHTEFEFNYASIILKPYSGSNGTSSQLLKSIINMLNDKDFPSESRIIDRHKNQKKHQRENL